MLINVENINLEKLKDLFLINRNLDNKIFETAKNYKIGYKEIEYRQYISLSFQTPLSSYPNHEHLWYLPVKKYIGAVTREVLIEKIHKNKYK